jgi:hypothetical protein
MPGQGDFKGTGTINIDVLSELDLKQGNEYKINFVIDTITVFKKNEVFPGMGILYRNIGFTVSDVTDSNRILIHETPEHYSGDNIIYDENGEFYYMNPNLSLDPFDGIKLSSTDVPSAEAYYDPEISGWIVGAGAIQDSITINAYKMFPWQTDVVFTSGDITYTSKATNVSGIRRVDGIDPFVRNLVLPGQTFNFYVENKQFQDSTGGNYLLDVVAYDANENGQFDMLEDDIIVGYTSRDDDEWKWEITIATFNFRTAASEEDLPAAGDVYRYDSQRPFVATDEFIIKVVESSQEKQEAAEDLDKIRVVPNPYIVTNMMEPAVRNIYLNQRRRLMFTHIPAQCTIKIFTISGYLVDEIEVYNEPSDGIVHWDLLTREGLEIAPGVYVYHLKSTATGKEKMGKFAIVK